MACKAAAWIFRTLNLEAFAGESDRSDPPVSFHVAKKKPEPNQGEQGRSRVPYNSRAPPLFQPLHSSVPSPFSSHIDIRRPYRYMLRSLAPLTYFCLTKKFVPTEKKWKWSIFRIFKCFSRLTRGLFPQLFFMPCQTKTLFSRAFGSFLLTTKINARSLCSLGGFSTVFCPCSFLLVYTMSGRIFSKTI